MKIEHVAFQMPDPVAAAAWYVKHLGCRVARSTNGQAPFAYFLMDAAGQSMVEIYRNPKVPVPDYRQVDPLLVHLAFYAEDVAATRARLLAAGATAEGEVNTGETGDQFCMLRDPWGFPLQLVCRKQRMI